MDVSATKDDSSRKCRLHHLSPEADRPHRADLLTSLDNGAGADDAGCGDSD